MLWWIGPVAAGFAAWRLWDQSRTVAWVAVAVAVVGVWTAGIANNYQRGEEQSIPNAVARLNMLAFFGGIAVLAASFFL